METVWRVENEDGEGPYRIEAKTGHILDFTATYRHPTPWQEEGIARCTRDGEQCAFESESQARAWFTERELQELEKLGYKLKKIEATVTARGEAQILIIKEGVSVEC